MKKYNLYVIYIIANVAININIMYTYCHKHLS